MNPVIKHLAAAEKEAEGGSSIWLHIIEAMEGLYVQGYDVPRAWEVAYLDRIRAPKMCYPED
ncbi:Uncharacterised protein [uncultured archaeon]|nr:Uncharacterised protein [uncultured archaeon]